MTTALAIRPAIATPSLPIAHAPSCTEHVPGGSYVALSKPLAAVSGVLLAWLRFGIGAVAAMFIGCRKTAEEPVLGPAPGVCCSPEPCWGIFCSPCMIYGVSLTSAVTAGSSWRHSGRRGADELAFLRAQ